jgi:hypothetical protein
VVDRNDAAQLSTHVAATCALLPFSSVAASVLPTIVSFLLQALNKVIDSATISRVLIPEEVNFFIVFILWIITIPFHIEDSEHLTGTSRLKSINV